MDRINYGYSTKNITIPPRNEYLKRLIEKTELFVKRIRWKAFFFLHPENYETSKETYGFKTRKCPPIIDELTEFEDSLQQLIRNVRFKTVKCAFQQKLAIDNKAMRGSSKLVISADKTTNFYQMSPAAYNKLVTENVTAVYKRALESDIIKVTNEAKNIADELNLGDRIESPAKNEAFITLKDHKKNFDTKPKCRLINPAKSELGRISKVILDRVNSEVISQTGINQWKNSSAVLQWFKSIRDKPQHSFICFDIVDFYPSITEELLTDALSFAQRFAAITAKEWNIIMHCKKSFLFNSEVPHIKRSDSGMFDVTMGSFDGAEV